MIENIIEQSLEYLKLRATDRKTMILGVSGGADSALVAALARQVCDKTGLRLIGVSMPIISNKPDEIARAEMVGNAFCDSFATKNLTELYIAAIKGFVIEDYDSSPFAALRKGNIKTRLRMIYLYDLAQYLKGFVLSTDNFTEYLLGFWTLHGDVGDFGMLQNAWKTEVYCMMDYLASRVYIGKALKDKAEALRACLDAQPTDGLGVSDTDFDQIFPGYNKDASPRKNYEEVDKALYEIITSGKSANTHLMAQHIRTHFKRENPFNIQRKFLLYKPFYI
jgi:NAD+ synthetase